ncbi:hypothetical protein ABT009_46890 [Streptomyces sp. NPDC002896]|uniref:hypothetical protein n=1 Tax=Streptomyces sp. NPDC002896 TaxID=3154438 RepID=UPI00331AD990
MPAANTLSLSCRLRNAKSAGMTAPGRSSFWWTSGFRPADETTMLRYRVVVAGPVAAAHLI